METVDAIPRPSWWYQKEPFDPNFTFVIDGRVTRYMDSPIAEKYNFEPIDRFFAVGLPPEEREVRDHLLLAHTLRNRVTRWAFWWSQFFRETGNYKACRRAFNHLEVLCATSLEHRAAFLRMANGDVFPLGIRLELKKIVTRRDRIIC
jgi:hypothetical protein